MWLNSRSGPGQNRSSSARSWLTIPVRACDEILPRAGQRPDRLRLIANRARAPGSGDDRCARARRARTRQTDPTSRARPGTGHAPPRPCSGAAAAPAAPHPSSRSTSSPSGRSIATSTTSSRTSMRHSALSPFSSCAIGRREHLRRPPRRPRARRACPPPSRSRHTGSPSPPSTNRVTFTAPRPEVPVGSARGAWAARHVLARLAWFPPAATSNRACGSPAHGSPTFFTVGIQRPWRHDR